MKNENTRCGTIMVLFLILLPILVLFVGFSVDFAYIQKTRSELRRATDLAAKAAAAKLCETESKGQARKTAKEVAQLNTVNGKGLTLHKDDIVFGYSKEQPDGSWDFTLDPSDDDKGHPNAVRINGRRTSASPDGEVQSFFGSLYGQPVFEPQFSATAAFVHVDVCLVLDRSSSMKLPSSSTEPLMSGSDPRFCNAPWADSRWIALENAVNVFLDQLDTSKSKEQVAVVTFASDYTNCGVTTTKVSVDQSLTKNTSKVRSTMKDKSGEKWNGMTDIAAGIVEGHKVLTGADARTNSLKFLIVLTDGQYTEADPAVAAQAAADAGINIYTITFSAGANQTDMKNLATLGNGRHYHADDATELATAFEDLGGSLASLVQ